MKQIGPTDSKMDDGRSTYDSNKFISKSYFVFLKHFSIKEASKYYTIKCPGIMDGRLNTNSLSCTINRLRTVGMSQI